MSFKPGEVLAVWISTTKLLVIFHGFILFTYLLKKIDFFYHVLLIITLGMVDKLEAGSSIFMHGIVVALSHFLNLCGVNQYPI